MTNRSNSSKEDELNNILEDLKNDYKSQMPSRLAKLESLTQKNDFAGLALEYHKLKGTGKTYGFAEISKISEQLEKICENSQDHKLIVIGLELLKKYFTSLEGHSNNEKFNLETDESYIALKTGAL
jgi:HPt (histidine-containing phosphotransfer) domain-containing protein